jgi:subtilisin family serine protease
VRPASGAATSASSGVSELSSELGGSQPAAPEAGRTPTQSPLVVVPARCGPWRGRTEWFLACLILLWQSGATRADDTKDVHPSRVIAKYRARPALAAINRALAPHRFAIRKHFPLLPGLVVMESLPAPQGPAKLAEATDRAKGLRQRIETLRQSGLFEFVEPDYVLHAHSSPTDSAFTSGILWGLRNDGASGGVPGADIQAADAWDITTGSTNVIVAVLDTGIRFTHHDLAAQMWRNPGETPGNGIDDDHNGYVDDVFGINAITGTGNPSDDQGHGTHVAGTIGAAANNGGPHVGVAWRVQLMACKFLDAEGSGYTSDAIECISYAIARGARIINASWGGDSYSQALFDAMSAAAAQNVLFVAAAGNDSVDNDVYPSYPCNYQLDNVIAVAALDRADKLAAFSNYGRNTVHLGAPGVQIYSCSSTSDDSYFYLDGTSMATPHATGTAALLLARFPDSSALELRQRLLTTVVPIPALAGKSVTGGRLNAFNALSAVADGLLEILPSPSPGAGVVAGRNLPLRVRVTDLAPVTNATVIALDESGTNYSLLDNGAVPDQQAGDATYGGFIPVPAASSNLDLTLIVVAPGKESKVLCIHFPLLFPPANDDFVNAVELLGTAASVTSSNVSATREEGEPGHTLLNAGGKSVWWSWQAPEDGILTVNTDGSDFDTLLGVYTGLTVTALTPIASDDDSGEGSRSSVTLIVERNQTYHIAVDGFSGDSGQIRLNLSFIPPPPPPGNDDFANAFVLNGPSNAVSASNISATKQTGEPEHAGNAGGRSVWWTWPAPSSGTTTVKTDDSNFDTTLAVYTGATVSNLTTVASDDDSGEGVRSLVTFNASAGSVYQIAVDGYDGAFGDIALKVVLEVMPPPPANDDFETAAALIGPVVEVNGANHGATRQSGEPEHAANSGGKSVWWAWCAPADGRVTVTTVGSDFDTLLAVYAGTSLTNLGALASNDQDPTGGVSSRLAFNAVGGNSYYIAVDGKNQGYGAANGEIVLNLALKPPPAPATNDNFSQRIALTGLTNVLTAYSDAATREPNEPNHANKPGGKSLWWTWTVACCGTVILSTEGSDFDTLLAVYSGGTLSSLVPIAGDDDSGQGLNSLVVFRATAGANYQIALDGYRGSSGEIKLFLGLAPDPPPPTNDNFADRILIPDVAQPILGTTLGATSEPGEPAHAGQPARHSVWWSWTAPTNAVLLLDTSGSDFDTRLSVYTGSSVTNLVEVAANNDGDQGPNSELSLEVLAGQTYQLAVDGAGDAMGGIQLHLALIPIELPVITSQPQSQLVDAGAVVAFTVKVSSLAPPGFQWRRNGLLLTNDNARTFGASANQLVLLGVEGRDIGIYTVEVRSSAGSVMSAEAALLVNTAFRLQVGPEPLSANGTFSFDLGGRAGLNYSVEVSSNLVNWVQFGTFPNTNGLIRIADPESPGHPVRFYRALELP